MCKNYGERGILALSRTKRGRRQGSNLQVRPDHSGDQTMSSLSNCHMRVVDGVQKLSTLHDIHK